MNISYCEYENALTHMNVIEIDNSRTDRESICFCITILNS